MKIKSKSFICVVFVVSLFAFECVGSIARLLRVSQERGNGSRGNSKVHFSLGESALDKIVAVKDAGVSLDEAKYCEDVAEVLGNYPSIVQFERFGVVELENSLNALLSLVATKESNASKKTDVNEDYFSNLISINPYGLFCKMPKVDKMLSSNAVLLEKNLEKWESEFTSLKKNLQRFVDGKDVESCKEKLAVMEKYLSRTRTVKGRVVDSMGVSLKFFDNNLKQNDAFRHIVFSRALRHFVKSEEKHYLHLAFLIEYYENDKDVDEKFVSALNNSSDNALKKFFFIDEVDYGKLKKKFNNLEFDAPIEEGLGRQQQMKKGLKDLGDSLGGPDKQEKDSFVLTDDDIDSMIQDAFQKEKSAQSLSSALQKHQGGKQKRKPRRG